MPETITRLILIATLLPLASFVVVIFLGKRLMDKLAGWFATAVMAGSFACAVAALVLWQQSDGVTIAWRVPWIPIPGMADGGPGWLYLGFLIDSLCIAMVTMVSGVSMLVHLYSIGYMAGDSRYERFFAYLSLFTFSMLGIVTANGLMQLFVMWELVGLTSYLLIGFWFENRGPQLACKKAFVMNRIGDTGFLIGFGILFTKLGANVLLPAAEGGMFDSVRGLLEADGHSVIANPPLWLTLAGIGLFCGAIGKSAQFPLHTWLPDAMEGPTPVSSIVHSATMVAAGVYLTARIYPILTPAAHLFIATIGLITLVIAACMALVMTDIKRVLAYSTLSQLGYMILGLGAGAYSFALYHLIAHAFFKCCLFQCAGSVIHATHKQDMRDYGGLGKKLPITAACYLVCTLAIAGASIPWTGIGISGFYSKDGIIAGALSYGQALGGLGPIFCWVPTIVAYITVFYMARSFALTFLGRPRDKHAYEHAHESPATMWLPQVALAAMAVLSVPMILAFWLNLINDTNAAMVAAGVTWVQSGLEHDMPHAMHFVHGALLHGLAWIIMLILGIGIYRGGFGMADRLLAIPPLGLLHTWARNKFYFDALYDVFAVAVAKAVVTFVGLFDANVIDGAVNDAGQLGRVTAFLVGRFDLAVVDGAFDAAAATAHGSGELLRRAHVGRIRAYVLMAFASALIVGAVVVVTIVMMAK